ncbi:UNKNOWN [Stylonychia lemnae]|uniref:Uncharacterized protein n=1 Tax=Stylonychia lemnae TaxID=5949 RepID=A0A078AG64_STYLE|nr:UNKNOWN [Stylonychia lemnae]|eukprot:CDW80472.1 UNKNOWN [Stylonychia lemnae]
MQVKNEKELTIIHDNEEQEEDAFDQFIKKLGQNDKKEFSVDIIPRSFLNDVALKKKKTRVAKKEMAKSALGTDILKKNKIFMSQTNDIQPKINKQNDEKSSIAYSYLKGSDSDSASLMNKETPSQMSK